MRRLAFVYAALLVVVPHAPTEAGAAGGAHRNAVRDYLIVKHCRLDSDEVAAGFRIEVIDLIERDGVSPTAARIDRDAAAEQVRTQWRNRGMGSRDPRCLTKGREAVRRFLSVLDL